MSVIDLLLLILSFSVHSFAAPAWKRGVQNFVFSGDAPLTVNAATLAAALTCPNGNPSSKSPPVLLVHGTTSTGEESWGGGYVPVRTASLSPRYTILTFARFIGSAEQRLHCVLRDSS